MEVFGYELNEIALLIAALVTGYAAYAMFVAQLGGDWSNVPMYARFTVVVAMPFVIYWVTDRMLEG